MVTCCPHPISRTGQGRAHARSSRLPVTPNASKSCTAIRTRPVARVAAPIRPRRKGSAIVARHPWLALGRRRALLLGALSAVAAFVFFKGILMWTGRIVPRKYDQFCQITTIAAVVVLVWDLGVRWVSVETTRPHADDLAPYATLGIRTPTAAAWKLSPPR